MNHELITIQKRGKLNTIISIDEIGPGGANHEYLIERKKLCSSDEQMNLGYIKFQKGPRNEEGSQHGIIDSDLLEVVRDRIKSFQEGPFSSRENAMVLTHIEEALMWLNRRVEDRLERAVLGTYNK